MSKKQLKKLFEEQERAKLEQLEKEIEEEDTAPTHQRTLFNKFALLQKDGESEEEVISEEELDVSQPSSSQKRRANKKKKKKRNEVKEETEDQILAKAIKENKSVVANGIFDAEEVSLEAVFKIDPKLLDASSELKKALGKAFKDVSQSGPSNNRSHQKTRAFGRIVKSKMSWPPLKSIGLSMTFEKKDCCNFYFKFVHNSQYETLEKLFWHAEKTMDIGTAQEILHTSGYHLNSLLMIANMHLIQDDVTQSTDTIERGILFCDQAFAAKFEPFTWNHRIDYMNYENRAFYLLLHRHMLNVMNKRCFETSLTFAKLIFKMDPHKDPLAVLMIIDILAIKARNYSWLEMFYNAANNWKNLHLLPNMKYSLALAKFLSGDTTTANEMLKDALIAFPSVVTELLDELQIRPDRLVENHDHFSNFSANKEPEGLKMATKIYVKQSQELWKVPTTLSWLETVTREVASDKKAMKKMAEWRIKRKTIFTGIAPNVKRLSCLLGYTPSLSVTDPVPPQNGTARYSREDGNGLMRSNDPFWATFFRSMYPDWDPSVDLNTSLQMLLGSVRDMTDRLGRLGGDNNERGQEGANAHVPEQEHDDEQHGDNN